MMNHTSVQQARESWYREFFRGKTRIIMAWVLSLAIGFYAREYPSIPGMILCFLGASLRYWASGYLRKDSRPAVGGPYAFVRNPLYLGTYLMAVGAVLSLGNMILFLVVTLLFATVYHFVILDEETKLQKIFKEPYYLYCKAVPRFFPRLWPPFFPAQQKELIAVNPDLTQHRFSHELAQENKAYEAYLSFLGLILYISLCAYGWSFLTTRI
jgi:protein-S-isoprenylcysteine O-methyltransferase Ste14